MTRPSYQIDKGIPIPESRGRPGKYPFADMKPGDSVLIPGKRATQLGGPLAYHRGKGLELTSRTVEGGCRVWRVA